ncbi:MAG: DnaJ domain-containing protein [Deltaproteobacteria bacterium]|nr:DnaJ domain-containing protein [Deltaproteobacteria bacterium]
MQKSPLSADECLAIKRVERLGREGTFFSVLGLDTSAVKEDVERAYRDYVREWHPDRFYSRDAAELMAVIEENFVNVTRAYKTLRESNKRLIYERDLAAKGVAVAPVLQKPASPPPSGFEVKIDRGAQGPRIATTDGAPRPPPRPAASPSVMSKIKAQIADQLERAVGYYQAGLEDFRAGRFAKAESSLYLASLYDPRNPTYVDLFNQARAKARQQRGATFVSLGQQAEQYQNVRDAMTNYRKAIDCDPEDGIAYARLAHLLRAHENDHREAVNLMRRAVSNEPRCPDFRVQLAEMYADLKMEANAVREILAALEVDPRHEGALEMQKKIRRR